MKTQTTHTATPNENFLCDTLEKAQFSRKSISDIVRAVNVHEELLQAAKDMLANMETYYEINPNEDDPLKTFRDAIAKAEAK